MRTIKFMVTIDCADSENPDLALVDQMLDLSMQELVYDDQFIAALDEKQAVSVQVEMVK